MSDQFSHPQNNLGSRFDDLERTDVLPQLALRAESDETEILPRPSQPSGLIASALAEHAAKPFGAAAQTQNSNARITALPAKLSTTDLAVGGIRGKIADLENRLIEAQDSHLNLRHQYEQLEQRHRSAEERAGKAELSYVQQAAELHRIEQDAAEAQGRLHEERVRQQAQLAEAERQVIDARTRGDKRAASLDQLLSEQNGRAVQHERTVAEARVELEKSRGELTVAQTAIRSLQERLSEQTQAAAEMTRLYSQQNSVVESNSELIVDSEKKLNELRAEKTNAEKRIAAVDIELRSAQQAAANLQTDITSKQRHISSLESGLQIRDQTITTLKRQLTENEQANTDIVAAKAALMQRCTELEGEAKAARSTATHAEHEMARLNAALSGNDARINELSAALRTAERNLKDRETEIAAVMDRDAALRSEHAQASESSNALRLQLSDKENQLGELQTQLTTVTSELSTALASHRESQLRQASSVGDVQTLHGELASARAAMEEVVTERNQLELENQSGRAELSRIQSRYEEAVQTIVAARETISAGEQKKASLEQKLQSATLRIDETNARLERAATAAEEFNSQLRQRDNRIAMLEQKCAENADALNAISQDIERVNSANPSERLAAMGYALEALDSLGTVHRINRSTTTVGRVGSNDIGIDSTSVSRYHARIVVQPEGVWLIDLQSTNGCGVNGRRISRQILCEGDAVAIGHCKFRFSALGTAKSANDASSVTHDDAAHDEFPLLQESLLVPHDNHREQRH